MNWRTHMLESYDPALAPRLVVADPDNLLRDADVHLELTGRGYTILPYDDPIAFRVAYEAAYDQPLIVVLWDRARTLETLPADVLARCARRAAGLAAFFPRLHIPVLAALPSTQLDRLWAIYGQQRGPALGARMTAEIVLQACYSITLAALQTPSDVLTLLLQIHAAPQPLPEALLAIVQTHIQTLPHLTDWPLAKLLRDRATFDAFLEHAWPRFLHEGGIMITPGSEPSQLNEWRATYGAAPALPFDDPRVWPLVDTLFLAGRLRPYIVPARWSAQPPYTVGVAHAGAPDHVARGRQLADTVLSRCPQADSPALEWLAIAPLIGELMALQHTSDEQLYLTDTLQHLRTIFAAWMQTRYAALQTAAPYPVPQLVSHIAHGLASERSRGKLKQALIVLDGMALDQWVAIRDIWSAQNQPLLWDERAVFAWVPTLTHISRQAIFAGKPPSSFAASINRTDREEHHWKSLWQSYGLNENSAVLLKGLQGVDSQRAAAELRELDEILATPAVQVIGIVVDTIDKIAHGMRLGEAGMAQQVQQWATGGWLATVVQRLHAAGYHVTLTADHGNIAVRGIGRVADGILAEDRGVRARVYTDHLLRDRTVSAVPGAIAWPGVGLPATVSAALAPPGSAFTTAGQYLVAHGGIDLREVMVPCITLRPADRDEPR